MELAYSHFNDIFCEDVKQATLIHGDFFIANILVNNKSLEPVAFIDPYESMWADLDYELFALDNVNGNCFNLFETYKSKVSLSKMCEIKCAFYALFKEIMWFQVYGSKSDPFIKGLCKKMEKQLLVYNMI